MTLNDDNPLRLNPELTHTSISSGSSSSSSFSVKSESTGPETEFAKCQQRQRQQPRMDVFRLPVAATVATTSIPTSITPTLPNDNNNNNNNDNSAIVEYPPRIPVVMRHPHLIASVKQYRSEAQQQQLQQHIISESFIPMAPDMVKPPRRRRRPPFSYSSLIAQAILEADQERMTLQEIYRWIKEKYPALYDAEDTGWQNTIRHNLSLNKCFKKIPKAELDGSNSRGKGGFWTVDPNYMEKFKNGAFARGSSSTLLSKRKNPRQIRMKPPPSSPSSQLFIPENMNISSPSLQATTTPPLSALPLSSSQPPPTSLSISASNTTLFQASSHISPPLPTSSMEISHSASYSTRPFSSSPSQQLLPTLDSQLQKSSPSSTSLASTTNTTTSISSPSSSYSSPKPNIMHVHNLLN